MIRGPATLRYGSTAIGGVVSATNNRIPEALPSCAAAPFQTYGLPAKAPLCELQSPSCVTVETRPAVSSVDRGVEGGILLDAGAGNFAVHADAYGRKAAITIFRAIRICSTRPGRSTASPNRPRRRQAGRSAAHIFSTVASSAPRSRKTIALYHIPGHGGRRARHPDRRASDQIHRKRRISARCGGDRGHSVLGRRDRLQAQ